MAGVYSFSQMIKCARCQISVKSYFTYCPNCGARLRTGSHYYKSLILFLIMSVLVFSTVAYITFFKPTAPIGSTPDFGKSLNPENQQSTHSFNFSHNLFSIAKSESPAVTISVGTVIIYDISGNQISRLPAAVSESGWIAIPAQLCVGGYSWYFHFAEGDALEIFGGILGDHDDIGIWQFENINQISGSLLSPAKPDRPMTWRSIVTEKSTELTEVSILSGQQNFYHILLAESMDEPGVLIQDQKIVGWSFGDLIGGGYLWKGPDESNLVVELSVYDFYRLTFQNSREEQFIIAYSQKDLSPVTQLESFVNGFRLEPMLIDDDTPVHLKSKAVIAIMRSIISQIIEEGNLHEVVSVFDSKVLSAIGDGSFLIDVLTFGDQINGPEYSIDVIEYVLAGAGDFNDSQAYQIRQFRKALYRKWLTRLMDEGAYSKGLAAYQQVADSLIDDPAFHLLGVKLALVFNDWETAEEILNSHRFPIDLTDQVRILEGQIKELKFQENKIVVRFSPGAGRIPVTGVLNNRLRQNFIVDTGASMVTIPWAAARKLGVEIDGSTPLRKLTTAGGMIEAPQIILQSIQLDGWVEYNITAYVLDMPDQSGFGLLGLNYLNRFRMDLNTKSGILTLAPR